MRKHRAYTTSLLLLAGALTLASCAEHTAPIGPDGDQLATNPEHAKGHHKKPPVAVAGGPYSGIAAAGIQFDGTQSTDPAGPVAKLRYSWTFGDGATATGARPVHAYATPGTYTASLQVTDNKGVVSAPSTATVTVYGADVLVKDDFTRSVSPGWGTANVGGLWRIDAWLADAFSTDGSRGLVTAMTNEARNVIATDGYALNARGIVSFSIDRMPDNPARFYTVQVYGRRDDRVGDGDDYYRFRVRAFGNGQMDLRVEKAVHTVPTWLMDNLPIGTVWVPGQRYWIRWETVGTSPSTALRMRVWADETTEPSAWQVDIVSNEPALDVIGTTGIRVEGPNADQVNYPVTFSFDDLEYRRID